MALVLFPRAWLYQLLQAQILEVLHLNLGLTTEEPVTNSASLRSYASLSVNVVM